MATRLAVGDALFAPAHLDAEIVSALRVLSRPSSALRTAVPGALRHLAGRPVRRMQPAPLLQRTWELRDNLTPYDAAYVALTERLASPLITCDGKPAGAAGSRCAIQLIA